VFAPFPGRIGTLLTGYGMASVTICCKLQLQATQIMGIFKSLIAAALMVGARIGSASSPFKIALAAPLCGAEGREGGHPG
jgi:lactate permease